MYNVKSFSKQANAFFTKKGKSGNRMKAFANKQK
jgi:hypothetical protein